MATNTVRTEHDLYGAVVRMNQKRNVLRDYMESESHGAIVIKGVKYPGGRFYTYDHTYLGVKYPIVVAMYTQKVSDNGVDVIQLCSLYLNNLDEKDNIMDVETEYTDTDPYVVDTPTVNFERKLYCIELVEKYHSYAATDGSATHTDKNLWLNYAQQHSRCSLPSKAPCVGLRGIFGLVDSILTDIGYQGPLYCEDDSQFKKHEDDTVGYGTHMSRLMNGKKTLYESHGFVPVDDEDRPVDYSANVEMLMHLHVKLPALDFEGLVPDLMKRYAVLSGDAFDAYGKALGELRKVSYVNAQMTALRKITSRMICVDYHKSLLCDAKCAL